MAHPTYVLVLTVMWALVHQTALQCLTDNDAAMTVTQEGHDQLLQSQLQFSTDLLQTVGGLQSSENVFFSPYSVYNALLLTYFVSANHTEASLKNTLRIPEDQEKLSTLGAYSFEKYLQDMRAVKGSLNYRLSSANRIFVSSEKKVRPCLKKIFSKEIEMVDFGKDVSAAVKRINSWVSGQTRNNINDLLSPDSLNSNTDLVLVNAAYFRGFWKYQFSPSETRDSEFTLANGTTVPVMLMTLEGKFSHRTEEKLGLEVLELPYEGDDISMFILLPLNTSSTVIPELLNKTNAQMIQDIVNKSSAAVGEVSVAIPKFTVDQSLELTPVLELMGVGDLFQSSADLSSLTGSPGLRLDTAIHKAKITVDETGTEAAAATAIFANRFATDSFVANHPFVYFLFDKKSNILLFVGIFNSPQS